MSSQITPLYPVSGTDTAKVQGIPVSTVDPTNGQILVFNSATSQYEPSAAGDITGLGTAATRDVGQEAGNVPVLAANGTLMLSGGGEFGEGFLVLAGYTGHFTIAGSDESIVVGPTNYAGTPTSSPYLSIGFGGLRVGGTFGSFDAINGKVGVYDEVSEDYASLSATDGYIVLGRTGGAGAFVLGRSATKIFTLDAQAHTANRMVLLPDKDGTVAMLSDVGAVTPYNLGAISGFITIEYANGPYQYGYVTGDWAIDTFDGGAKGDELIIEIQWSTGAHEMDLSAARVTPSQLALMPITLEAYRCFLLTFRHMGGGWCLTDVTDSYPETED
jgi:hypothetical protein